MRLCLRVVKVENTPEQDRARQKRHFTLDCTLVEQTKDVEPNGITHSQH